VDVEAAARAGWQPLDLAKAYLDGGARFLQVRAKLLGSAAFLDLAQHVCELAESACALVIVNDRADVARLARAGGVHVGQDDLGVHAIRQILGGRGVIGLSTHTAAQIEAGAAAEVDYLAVGPVFGTATKATGYTAVGLDRVRYASACLRERRARASVVAIGGVTLENAPAAIAAGATAVAVIGDLLSTGDPTARTRAYVVRLTETSAV
jgi:thiamine-phosphate pyrophosphorylase